MSSLPNPSDINTWFAAITGAFTAIVDVIQKFRNLPQGILWKGGFWVYLGLFLIFNGFLAALVYSALLPLLANSLPASFTSSPDFLKAFASGLIFSAFIRLKLTTLTLKDGTEFPFGLELIYKILKDSCFEQINKIVRNMRVDESLKMAENVDLNQLKIRAKGIVKADSLKAPNAKLAAEYWIKTTENDSSTTEEEKSIAFAEFISFGFDENF